MKRIAPILRSVVWLLAAMVCLQTEPDRSRTGASVSLSAPPRPLPLTRELPRSFQVLAARNVETTPLRILPSRTVPAAAPSDLEGFFVRAVDPWFRRATGWQFYNPDRLDRGQESARTPQFAFAAGLRYRFSF